jgi:hypothetical protein
MVDARKWLRQNIAEEFADGQLDDVRRAARLRTIAEAAVRFPAVGFPQMVESDSELEGIYRFLEQWICRTGSCTSAAR